MKIVLLSNYLNHHMLPLCLAFSALNAVEFRFVATKEITPYRKSLGYPDYNSNYDFVVRAYEDENNKAYAKKLCDECDVLIYGSAPLEVAKERLRSDKLTFRYSERIYKKACPWYQIPLRAIKYNSLYGKKTNLYLLCASAYTAADYAKTRTFLNRAYKWGYFPEIKEHKEPAALILEKQKNTILWVGRFLDWKHPECAIAVAKRLRDDGYEFRLDMIGTGPMEEFLHAEIAKEGLGEYVRMLGAMKPEEVRKHMEESEIFLFTSDRGEGWGAVLNESMNSGCAVVASHAIGSAPFLIRDKENGLIYRDGDVEDLYQKAEWLLENPEKRSRMGAEAYRTVIDEWNPENAAWKLITLAKALLKGAENPFPYDEGICSKAEILKDGWYRKA